MKASMKNMRATMRGLEERVAELEGQVESMHRQELLQKASATSTDERQRIRHTIEYAETILAKLAKERTAGEKVSASDRETTRKRRRTE